MAKVRVATIGRSHITELFLDALSQVEKATYVAAYSRRFEDAKAFAEAHGASLWFDSLDDLAASDEVDAVYIAAPNGLHAKQAKQMIKAGKHVLVEKSFAANQKLGQEIIDLAREKHVVALEAARNTFGPGPEKLQELIERVGTPRKGTIRFSKITSRIAKLKAGERVNIFDPYMAAGSLMDIGVYPLEEVMQLFGKPESVKASALTHKVEPKCDNDPYTLIDLAGEAILTYPSFLIDISYGKVSNDYLSSQLEGDAGTLLWDEASLPYKFRFIPYVSSGGAFGSRGNGKAEDINLEAPKNDMVFEVQVFANAVLGDKENDKIVFGHQQNTLNVLAVSDEIRRQIGVKFPQDDE